MQYAICHSVFCTIIYAHLHLLVLFCVKTRSFDSCHEGQHLISMVIFYVAHV